MKKNAVIKRPVSLHAIKGSSYIRYYVIMNEVKMNDSNLKWHLWKTFARSGGQRTEKSWYE